ncbi:hypothetical protein Rcae01_01956 [Novipirellula caenicola]|uniref:Uncharacterized protein n=1 Tax=Novipirellula caenicola TaxID=1536901 RepID=A0ABP9VMT4_9BACT
MMPLVLLAAPGLVRFPRDKTLDFDRARPRDAPLPENPNLVPKWMTSGSHPPKCWQVAPAAIPTYRARDRLNYHRVTVLCQPNYDSPLICADDQDP